MTDRNSRTTNYSYDSLNRLTEEEWEDGSNIIIYDYDKGSRLLSVSDSFSSYGYSYDERNLLTSVDNLGTVGVPNVVLEYDYDNVGNMLSVTDTIEGVVSGVEEFTLDELNRIVSITQSGIGVTDKRVDFTYDKASQLKEIDRFSDLAGTQLVAESDYDYDDFGRLIDLVHNNSTGTIANYNWIYDEANRIEQFTSPDGVVVYNYDDTNQLTSADYNYQDDESYSYDGTGNRTNGGYVTGDNNQLLSDGVYNYTYDNEGNRLDRTEITTGEVTEYQWDYRNRLVGVVTKDVSGNVLATVEYQYDVYDRRIAKSVDSDGDGNPNVEERYVLDGDEIALVFDEEGNLKERFLHGVTIDQVIAIENADGSVYWALADNLGSVRYVLNNDGNIINEITYDAFGEVTSESHPSVDFRFGYTGREFDEETGQHYYRSRYYDSSVGRFISEDTIGFAGGDTNLYRYVGNSPLRYTDPYGEDWYDNANKADQFLAGFGDAVTFGGTTLLREKLYGETATKNHEGGLFTAGQITGTVASTAAGFGTVDKLGKGVGLTQRVLQTYDVLGTGIGAYQATTKFMNGCGSASDLLNFVPALDFVGGKLLRRSDNVLKNADGNLDDTIDSLNPKTLKEKVEPPECFVAGTYVLTAKGKKKIDHLRPGDWVISWDEEKGIITEAPVTEWYVRETASIINIFIGLEKISCTTDHPFWVEGKGWVLAFQLKRGMILRTHKGESVVIDQISLRHEVTQVYNVEIDGLHTYFVSDFEILSHNMCGKTGRISNINIPSNKAIKVDMSEDTLATYGKPVTLEQARKAVENDINIYTSSRKAAEEIAGKGFVGPEIHLDKKGGKRFWHFHRRSKKNTRRGGHGRKGVHIFFGSGEDNS